MPYCTFFGHRDCPESIKPLLYQAVKELIESGKADTFYVGNHGNFDRMALSVLRELSKQYPNISYFEVLAYMPQKKSEFDTHDYSRTILPESVAAAPKKFAILRRNDWMLRQCDYVITYVTRNFGGASNFAKKSAKKRKNIIALANI